MALAIVTSFAVVVAWMAPARYAPLVKPEGESGAPPLRGWAALAATVVFTASFGAVAVYLQPLAHEAGLDANVARLALTLSLLAQVVGGSVAAVVAGRLHYILVFTLGTAAFLVCWAVMGAPVPGWAFVAANVAGGFIYLLDDALSGADDDRGRSIAPGCGDGRRRAGAGAGPSGRWRRRFSSAMPTCMARFGWARCCCSAGWR